MAVVDPAGALIDIEAIARPNPRPFPARVALALEGAEGFAACSDAVASVRGSMVKLDVGCVACIVRVVVTRPEPSTLSQVPTAGALSDWRKWWEGKSMSMTTTSTT